MPPSRKICGDTFAGSLNATVPLPVLIDRPVQIGPPSVDLDIGLVDEPAVTRHVTAGPCRLDERGCEPLNPPIHRDVIDIHPTLGHQLLDVAVGQAIPQIPPHGHREHLTRKPETSEHGGRRRGHSDQSHARARSLNATVPLGIVTPGSRPPGIRHEVTLTEGQTKVVGGIALTLLDAFATGNLEHDAADVSLTTRTG